MSREIKSTKAPTISSTSFDGKNVLEFNEGNHRYKLNGKSVVSTTTFCKAGYPTSLGLVHYEKEHALNSLFKALTTPSDKGYYPRDAFWPVIEDTRKTLFKEAHSAYKVPLQEAADIGTITHSYAELYSLGKVEEAEQLLNKLRTATVWPLISNCIERYKDWATDNLGKIVEAESLVASIKFAFCGKIDRLDIVDGKLRLRDYKTSKAIFLDQYIQLAAYSLAIKEWMGLDVTELEVLRFGKEDGKFETLLINDPLEIKMFQDQAIRCRYTYEFKKLENDERWKR